MRKGHAILVLGLLLSVYPASAQKLKIYPLTVSIHAGVVPSLTQSDIQQTLALASNLLQQSPNGCGVGFQLKGAVTTFTSAPAIINNATDLEAVQSVLADVKVIQEINYCINGPENGLIGCSWRPNSRPRTMIVTTQMHGYGVDPMLWAHEFGHVTGLLHRSDDQEALMTPCAIDTFNQNINSNECSHFLAGPAQHYPPGSGPMCSNNFTRRRTD